MFNSEIFSSWAAILIGALFFAALFGLLGSMIELVQDGSMQLNRQTLKLGWLAFIGYLCVALTIRVRNLSQN